MIRKPCSGRTDFQTLTLQFDVEAYPPTQEEVLFGLDVYEVFKVSLHIYRVDFIRTANGPLLMEVESVDPFHYGHLSPGYAETIGNFYREQMNSMVVI